MRGIVVLAITSTIVAAGTIVPTSGALAATVEPGDATGAGILAEFSSGALLDHPGCYANVMNSDYAFTHDFAIDVPHTWNFFGNDILELKPRPFGVVEANTSDQYYNDWFGSDLGNSPWGSLPNTNEFMPLDYTDTWWDTHNNVNAGSATYGEVTFEGHWALCVTWSNVMPSSDDEPSGMSQPSNTFQALFVDRADRADGAFDLIYNYDSVEWPSAQNAWEAGDPMAAGWIARDPSVCAGWVEAGGINASLSLAYFTGYTLDGVQVSPDPYYDTCTKLPPGTLVSHPAQSTALTGNDSPIGLARTSTNSTVPGRHVWEFSSGTELNGGGDHILDWTDSIYTASTESRPPYAPYPNWETFIREGRPELVVNGLKVIGDSYISGEGVGDYYPYTNTPGVNMCHRSFKAYPALLAGKNSPFGPVLLDSWACSGSILANMRSRVESDIDPAWDDPLLAESDGTGWTSEARSPLDRLSTTDAVVQLSISGNDMLFVDVVRACVTSGSDNNLETAASWLARLTGPALDQLIGNSCMEWDQTLKDKYEMIIEGGQILSLLEEIHERAPHAAILLSGYPRFYPADEENSMGTNLACTTTTVSVKKWINNWISKLNGGLESQVLKAQRSGVPVQFIDIENMAGGHELCSDQVTSSWYMNGIEFSKAESQENMHPNSRGHEAIAEIVRKNFVVDQNFRPAGSKVNRMVVVVPSREKVVIHLPPVNPVQDAYMSGMSVSAVTAGGTVLTPYYTPGGGAAPISAQQLRTALDPLAAIGDADFDMVLIAPDGTRYAVGDQAPGFTSLESPTTESMQIAGTDFEGWQLELTGVNMPEGGQQVSVDVSYDQTPNEEPLAVIDSTVDGRTVTVSASNSTDPDGELVEYFWDFGDGSTATGVTATHTYEFDAAKNVALQVTDSRGASAFTITELLVASTLELGELSALDGTLAPATVAPGATLSLKANVGAVFATTQLAYDALMQQPVPCTGTDAPGAEELLASVDDFPLVATGNPNEVGFSIDVPAAWEGTCRTVTLTLSDRSQASVTFKVETPVDPEPTSYFKGFTSWTGWGEVPEVSLAGSYLAFGVDLEGKQGKNALKREDIATRPASCGTGDALTSTWTKANKPTVIYNRWTGDFVVTFDTPRSWGGTCREVQTSFGDGSSASFVVYFHAPSYSHWHHFAWSRSHGSRH